MQQSCSSKDILITSRPRLPGPLISNVEVNNNASTGVLAASIGRNRDNNEKIIFFIYFHNSCIRNGEHLILLIKTGNVHKEIMLSHAIINTFKKCEGEKLKHDQKCW